MRFCHHKLRSPAQCLIFTSVIVFALTSVSANRICWSNNCADGHWCFQTCNVTAHQFSCLAQYRESLNGVKAPSFFGCHDRVCDEVCEPTEELTSNFICCCSGDLCNEIEGLTPTEETPTASPNPHTTPAIDTSDDVIVCEEYDCGDNPDDCFYGYVECPTNQSCLAEYKYNDEDSLYHLSKKQCTADPLCNNHICLMNTNEDHQTASCCCNRDLCNRDITFSLPESVDMMIFDPCEDMGCNHSCIVHDGVPHCYCDSGYILSDDKNTCVDLDECSHYNGHCDHHCINEIGSYHCGCPDYQRLSDDGLSCEDTGLICHYLSCNATGIGCDAGYVNDYCDTNDRGEPIQKSRQFCQATYRLKDDGTFEPRFLSCFEGNFDCRSDSECILEETLSSAKFYHCCCKENYCNGNIDVLFPPNDTTTVVPSKTVPSVGTTEDPSKEPIPTSPDNSNSMSKSKIIFIVVVVMSVVLIIPVIAVGIGCICYMYYYGNKKSNIASISLLQDSERVHHSPDLAFHNLSFIDKIGQGRFAAVWRAKNIEAEVAVKVFPNSPLSHDSWSRECEIYSTPELEHKYILSFRGSLQKDTELWIVTDYYSRGSLHDLLKKQTLSLKQFCDLAESAAVGLAHLHDQRIVDGLTKKPSIAHRDLKSKNILVRNDSTCVISDFGLAIKFLNEETSSDAHGQVGTSRYMAPEVLEGAISFQREAYLRIDVYAFALILWELASCTSFSNGTMKQYRPPFDEFVSSNPSIEEMKDIVVTQFKRPTIPKGFTTSGEYDSLRDTIEESWDQEPEARLSAQCIAERIRTFKLSKFGSKDSGLTDSNSPAENTYNSESIDSQLAPTTPSLSMSGTMSPLTSKCILDSGTESGVFPGRALSNETIPLGAFSNNSNYFKGRNNTNNYNFGGSTIRCNLSSNRALYSLHSTETTV